MLSPIRQAHDQASALRALSKHERFKSLHGTRTHRLLFDNTLLSKVEGLSAN